MNCLLMTPPIFNHIRGSLLEVVEDGTIISPPIGLLMVAAYAETVDSVKVSVLDTRAERLSWEEIRKRINEIQPDVVGIQAMTFTLIDAYMLAGIVREVCPNAIIVMGGPHPSLYPGETVAHPNVDYVIHGEGELVFKNFLTALTHGNDVACIKGVVTKNTDTAHLEVHYIEDLDSLLLPARHLLNMRLYSSGLATTEYITTMMSSRGCPGKCTFCDRPHMGKRFRKRSAHAVVMEMKECVEKWGIKEIIFYDDTFTIDKPRVFELCGLLRKEKLDIKWDIRARIDTMSTEMISALKDAGCARIHYGIETGVERLQRHIQKNLNLTKVTDVVKETKKYGIETLGYFMLGLPSETIEEMKTTIDLMCSLPLDYAHITIFTPYPGTAAYELALRDGVYAQDYWKEFAISPSPEFVPPFWSENIAAEELHRMVRKAYRRFYFRPSYLFSRLLHVRNPKDLYKKGKIGLSLFLETALPIKKTA